MTLKELLKDEKPHYRRLFKELCKRVGVKLKDVELKKEDGEWLFPLEAYTWTKEEEDRLEKWMVAYIYKYRRKFGMGYASKEWIRVKAVPMFILQYSWKYSE